MYNSFKNNNKYTFVSYLLADCNDVICPFLFPWKSTSGVQDGPESFAGPDLAFLKEIQELAKGFAETTEKALALEKLWEENSKFSGML